VHRHCGIARPRLADADGERIPTDDLSMLASADGAAGGGAGDAHGDWHGAAHRGA